MMSLSEAKIRDEAELESLLVKDPDQIEKSFFILSNQRKAHGQTSMDILGLDSSNVLTIVELKVVSEPNQLRQALRYYDWVLQQGLDWFSAAYEQKLDKRQIADQMPQIFLVAPQFDAELVIEAKYLRDDIRLRLFRYLALAVGSKKEIVTIEESIPSVRTIESKPWTIQQNITYIIDADIRVLFVSTMESIRKIAEDVDERPASWVVSYWVAGRKIGEIYPKKKFFGAGYKVSPEEDNTKWASASAITTKEKADEIVEKFAAAYKLMKA
jgi:hypothetical protein